MKRLFFLHWTAFAPLSEMILSVCLGPLSSSAFRFPDLRISPSAISTLGTPVAIQEILIQGEWFFLFQSCFSYYKSVPFNINFKISFSMLIKKSLMNFDRMNFTMLDLPIWMWHANLLRSSLIFFDFFDQHFVIFIIQLLYVSC